MSAGIRGSEILLTELTDATFIKSEFLAGFLLLPDEFLFWAKCKKSAKPDRMWFNLRLNSINITKKDYYNNLYYYRLQYYCYQIIYFLCVLFSRTTELLVAKLI